jgi:CHAD domain-containing protein
MAVDTVGELFEQVVANGVGRLETHWDAALEGDVVGVHQARVALRRLRSQVAMLKPWADARWAKALIADLAALADPLGQVRDLDVLAERLTAEEGGDEGSAKLEARRARQRRKAQIRSRRLLTALEAQRRRDDIQVALAAPKLADVSINEVALAVVGAAWDDAAGAVAKLKAHPRDAALHRVRIRVKRLRYGASAVATGAQDPHKHLAKKAAAVQTVLGNLNDAAFAEAWLRDAASTSRQAAFAAGRLVEREQVRAHAARAGWKEPWMKLEAEATRVVGEGWATP